MNNALQPLPTQPADPDMALLFLGSFFETLHGASHRDHAMLDVLAAHHPGRVSESEHSDTSMS